MICDRIQARVKGKAYNMLLRRAMMDGLEAAVLSKRQEVKMLRVLLGVTKMNRVRSEYSSG